MWSAGQGRRAETATLVTGTGLGLALMVGGPGRPLCPGQNRAHGRSEDVLPGMPAELLLRAVDTWLPALGTGLMACHDTWACGSAAAKAWCSSADGMQPCKDPPCTKSHRKPTKAGLGPSGTSCEHLERATQQEASSGTMPACPRSLQGLPCLWPAHSGSHPSAPFPHFPRELQWGRVKVKCQL